MATNSPYDDSTFYDLENGLGRPLCHGTPDFRTRPQQVNFPVLPIQIKKFDGYPEDDPVKFLNDFKALMRMNGVNDPVRMMSAFSLYLSGPAHTWLQGLSGEEKSCWSALEMAFTTYYINPNPKNNAVLYAEAQAFNDLELTSSMKIEDYYGQVLKKGKRLGKSPLDLMTKFIGGLPTQLRFFVQAGRPKDIEKAMQSARMGNACGYRDSTKTCNAASVAPGRSAFSPTRDSRMDMLEEKMMTLMNAVTQMSVSNNQGQTNGGVQSTNNTCIQQTKKRACYKCGGTDHMKQRCNWTGVGEKNSTIRCQVCSQEGHGTLNCVKLNRGSSVADQVQN